MRVSVRALEKSDIDEEDIFEYISDWPDGCESGVRCIEGINASIDAETNGTYKIRKLRKMCIIFSVKVFGTAVGLT